MQTRLYPNVHPGAPSYSAVDPPREVLRTPAIGDIDGDMEPEIVDTGGRARLRVECRRLGRARLPRAARPGLLAAAGPHAPEPRQARLHRLAGARRPERRRQARHRDRRRSTSTSTPGTAAATPLPGFPKLLKDARPDVPGAEIINTPAVGDITGDGKPDIVVPDDRSSTTTRRLRRRPAEGGVGGFGNFLTNVLANVLGGSGRVYALDRNGNTLPGWPTKPNGIVPDALPFVGPGRRPHHGQRRRRPGARGDRQRRERRRDRHERATASNAVAYDSQPAGRRDASTTRR